MVLGLVYSSIEPASKNMGEYLISKHGFDERSPAVFENGGMRIYRIDTQVVDYSEIEKEALEIVCFLSRHSSAEGVLALTVHAMGNWNNENRLGGEPKRLSVAAPMAMRCALLELMKIEGTMQKTYEATHHGPLIDTPSFFIELGGNDEIRQDKIVAGQVADAAYNALTAPKEYDKVVIGIGGTHYPSKFTKLAVEKGYAFSHIMPKYAMYNKDETDNFDMLEQAVERSSEPPSLAVIEWKGINARARESVVKALGIIGIDYERV